MGGFTAEPPEGAAGKTVEERISASCIRTARNRVKVGRCPVPAMTIDRARHSMPKHVSAVKGSTVQGQKEIEGEEGRGREAVVEEDDEDVEDDEEPPAEAGAVAAAAFPDRTRRSRKKST